MAEILVALAAVLWALLGIFSVQIHKFGFSSTEISALRWIFAAVIMFVLVLVTDRKKLKIKLKDVWMFALTGVFSYMLTSTFYFISMELTSAAVANVLMYASPVWVLIMSRIFFNEKFNAIKLISIFGTVGGCCLSAALCQRVRAYSTRRELRSVLCRVCLTARTVLSARRFLQNTATRP